MLDSSMPLSFVDDLLRSGFHLCLHLYWTFFWWYSEGGKVFHYFSKMVLIQWCIWIHFQEGTIQNKIIKEKKKRWNQTQKAAFSCFIWGNFMFSQLKQAMIFWICYYISGLLKVIMQSLSKVCCKAPWADILKSPCKSAWHSLTRNKTRLKAPMFSLKTHMAVVAVLAYAG